jgi:hypothetical protein
MKSKKQIKMGNSGHFAECLHSAKSEESLPSATNPALGKVTIFAECHAHGTRQSNYLTLGKVTIFAEGRVHGTRQKKNLCRVPDPGTRQIVRYMPCSVTALKVCRARRFALGKGFAECPTKFTRQSPLCQQSLFRVSFAECF